MEFIGGGELFYYVKTARFSEEVCRYYCRQICDVVDHIHKRGFAHRDIKLQNFLVDKNFNLKIIDFGFTSSLKGRAFGVKHDHKHADRLMGTDCGTPFFKAPEVSSGELYDGTTADVFSLGVVFFCLMA